MKPSTATRLATIPCSAVKGSFSLRRTAGCWWLTVSVVMPVYSSWPVYSFPSLRRAVFNAYFA